MKKQFETFVQFMKARNGYARRDCNLKCVWPESISDFLHFNSTQVKINPFTVDDWKLIHDRIPVLSFGPFFRKVSDVEVEQPDGGGIIREHFPVWGVLSELRIEALDSVCSVDDLPEF